MEHKEWAIRKNIEPQEIVKFIDDVFEILEIRGKVGKQAGITFIVHSNEQNHAIPHVHAQYGEFEVSIAIETGEVLAGNLPKKNLKKAIEWVLSNRDKLQSDWNTYSLSAISNTTQSMIGVDWK